MFSEWEFAIMVVAWGLCAMALVLWGGAHGGDCGGER